MRTRVHAHCITTDTRRHELIADVALTRENAPRCHVGSHDDTPVVLL
jgi:hypothetical protein